MSEDAIEVRNNEERHRFEVEVDGHLAELTYRREGGTIRYNHTSVPTAIEGRGVAGRLAAHALDFARAEGLKVEPSCPFVRSYIERHPEYQELVAAE